MVNKEEVSKIHKAGFNCAQVVAYLCSDVSGVEEKDALAAMGGFGGGLRSGEVCGALAGAVYSLSLAFPYNDSENMTAKKQIAELTKDIVARFRAEFCSVNCRDLVDEFGNSRCEEFMAWAADRVHEMT